MSVNNSIGSSEIVVAAILPDVFPTRIGRLFVVVTRKSDVVMPEMRCVKQR
jgi:hypothetical protein